MNEKILDGKKLAKEIRTDLKNRIKDLQSKKEITPGLAVVIVGDDPASQTYVRMKEKACTEAGLYSEIHKLKADISSNELVAVIDRLNHDNNIHGILVQLPLPKGLDEKKINARIDPLKDVDGFHPFNVGNLFLGDPSFIPCTPKGIIRLLKHYKIPIEGKHVVIVGRSDIVGKPSASLFLKENATISICHSKTKDLSVLTSQADILVTAVGKPNLIYGDMIKKNAIIVDAGTTMVEGKVVGDVNYDNVIDKVKKITPVPGGVGPMTIAMLLENTMEAVFKNEIF